jgi:hypothetical protein
MSDDYLQKVREQFYRQVKNTRWDDDDRPQPKKQKFVRTPVVPTKPIPKSNETPFEKKMKFFKY